MEPTKKFWRSVGRRGPINTQRRPDVSIREIAYQHPFSVYHSLLAGTNWIAELDISPTAKKLTRLQGRDFRLAAQGVLDDA